MSRTPYSHEYNLRILETKHTQNHCAEPRCSLAGSPSWNTQRHEEAAAANLNRVDGIRLASRSLPHLAASDSRLTRRLSWPQLLSY
jgi:hypothetical protein